MRQYRLRNGGFSALRTAIESALDLGLQTVGLCRIFGFRHSLGELAKLFRRKSAAFCELPSELDYPRLLLLGQPLDFVDYFGRCHIAIITHPNPSAQSGQSEGRVAKWADAQDLKSWDHKKSCGLESHHLAPSLD